MQATEQKPFPTILIEPSEPRTIMDVVIKKPTNVDTITLVLKNAQKEIVKSVELPKNSEVSSLKFIGTTFQDPILEIILCSI